MKVHVIVEMHGGCVANLNVLRTEALAAERAVALITTGLLGDGESLEGADDASESDYPTREAYADALYNAHRDAFERTDADDEILWYEEEVEG